MEIGQNKFKNINKLNNGIMANNVPILKKSWIRFANQVRPHTGITDLNSLSHSVTKTNTQIHLNVWHNTKLILVTVTSKRSRLTHPLCYCPRLEPLNQNKNSQSGHRQRMTSHDLSLTVVVAARALGVTAFWVVAAFPGCTGGGVPTLGAAPAPPNMMFWRIKVGYGES